MSLPSVDRSLRVYQVDTRHSHCLGEDTSLQSIVVVVMATKPVFGTFCKGWKIKTPKSWKTKTIIILVFQGLSS